MKLIEEIAADCLDAYNQDHADDNETFFDLPYFERQCEDGYAALMDQQYREQYAALRAENRHKTAFVEIDAMALTYEDVKVEKEEDNTGYWFAKLKGKIFSFRFDQSSCGLQMVSPKKRGECVLIRSKPIQEYLDSFMPPSKLVHYWPYKDGIRFDSGCCKEVTVSYVAAPHPQLAVQDGMAFDIKTTVLNLMFNAKKGGQPPDTSNDSSKAVFNKDLDKDVK